MKTEEIKSLVSSAVAAALATTPAVAPAAVAATVLATIISVGKTFKMGSGTKTFLAIEIAGNIIDSVNYKVFKDGGTKVDNPQRSYKDKEGKTAYIDSVKLTDDVKAQIKAAAANTPEIAQSIAAYKTAATQAVATAVTTTAATAEIPDGV